MLHQRFPLAHLPTPAAPMDRLGAHLGLRAGTLWIKHDDLTGLALGGNKSRKLEYLCADALATGCDTLVTGGGAQSNHVRMTAAAAIRAGLRCTVVLAGDRPASPSGNLIVDELLAPDVVWAGELDYYGIEAAIVATAERLVADGRRPYPIPVGGASPRGALGYVGAADELSLQVPGLRTVVVADGSGGTHAGLAAGFMWLDMVLGVDVGTRPDLDERVPEMAAAVAGLAGRSAPEGTVRIDHDRFGPGYAAPTEAAREAVGLAARFEGVILDPVYTGKAMAGLVAGVRDGSIATDRPVVFLHTGGSPALFAEGFADWIGPGLS
jgi:D-cysteine desulfhydrase